MYSAPGVSFLAKSEIARWPVIGEGARAIGTTFVVRDDRSQRAGTRLDIALAMERRKKLVLFPSGTTCMSESKPWRKGAFEIAKAMDVPVQPFRISYAPLRVAAYIDKDFFPLHLYQLAKRGGVDAMIEFGEPTFVEDPIETCAAIRQWSRRS